MTPTKTLCASLAAISVAGLFAVAFSPSAYAIDPGWGVGRPGPGVYRRAPVARAVVRPVARAAVVAPVAPVARAAVVTPAAPVAAAVAPPAAPVAAAAVAAPGAPAAAAPVAAAAVTTPAVRAGRVVVVNSTRVYRPVVRGGRRVVVIR